MKRMTKEEFNSKDHNEKLIALGDAAYYLEKAKESVRNLEKEIVDMVMWMCRAHKEKDNA